MKKLKIPEPVYTFYDSNLIPKSLASYHKKNVKQGNKRRTLAGVYKQIRIMPLFGRLGDYVILSSCIKWIKNNKQKFTSREIRRCFNYFEDYNPRSISIYRDLTNQLLKVVRPQTFK